MTIEPTTSSGVCGEFIATAYKLEVGHPPGAPFFMLVARIFSLFALGDVTQVAKMINILSALASSFTILFLFWTISHLARKIVAKASEITPDKLIIIIGSAFVGAMAYTFSDTFWFSAVEGEVYATSSLFTAFVFWAILKWENVADQKYANRWIILIAYLMGLSIGVHLLNLLAIPAIVFVYYFKKYEVTKKGVISAALISIVIIAVIMYIIIPGIVKVAFWFELLFTNSLGLPYYTGLVVYTLLLLGGIVWGLHYTIKKQKVLLNTIILAFTMILIGYSSFALLVIRSLADPPMDENNPENICSFLSYLKREQYGDRPLWYGPHYNAPIKESKDGAPIYVMKNGRYEISGYRPEYVYDEQFMTVLPRMHSSKPEHVQEYKRWADVTGKSVRRMNRNGESEVIQCPTFGENLKFLFRYQIGHMYLRYFFWNFAGRQNDIQGHGEGHERILKGNWLCGIPFIDEMRLGPQDRLPESLTSNRAMNKYYMLPLILGLIGLIFQAQRTSREFFVVLLLFIFTGIAIVIFLNQTPIQPRERDYAYAASFYAYAIWIGLGVTAIHKGLKKYIPVKISAAVATLGCFLLVPVILANENWDDHDRSGRYTARDFAYNYLNSCAPNAILFTNGDNDTFPLWYAQEVEGIRTDVRVVNLSLLNTDWYIDQMVRKAYDSEPVPFSLTKEQYIQGKRDIVYLLEDPRLKGKHIGIKQAMEFVASDDSRTKVPQAPDYDFIPSKSLSVPVDSALVINNGTVKPGDADKIVKSINWTINRNYVMKSELMVLDLLATNNWERPVYFAITVGSDSYLNLEPYFQLEGLAYRVVPIKTVNKDGQIGRIENDIMYDNMVNNFKWGGINNPDVYLDENNIRMTMNLRNNFARLAFSLLNEGKKDSCVTVLDKCLELMPHEIVPYNYFMVRIVEAYYRAGEFDKANAIAQTLADYTQENLNYYFTLDADLLAEVDYEFRKDMAIFQELIRYTRLYDQTDLNKDLETRFDQMLQIYSPALR